MSIVVYDSFLGPTWPDAYYSRTTPIATINRKDHSLGTEQDQDLLVMDEAVELGLIDMHRHRPRVTLDVENQMFLASLGAYDHAAAANAMYQVTQLWRKHAPQVKIGNWNAPPVWPGVDIPSQASEPGMTEWSNANSDVVYLINSLDYFALNGYLHFTDIEDYKSYLNSFRDQTAQYRKETLLYIGPFWGGQSGQSGLIPDAELRTYLDVVAALDWVDGVVLWHGGVISYDVNSTSGLILQNFVLEHAQRENPLNSRIGDAASPNNLDLNDRIGAGSRADFLNYRVGG